MGISSLASLRDTLDGGTNISVIKPAASFVGSLNYTNIFDYWGFPGLPSAGVKPSTLAGAIYDKSTAGAVNLSTSTNAGDLYALANVQTSGHMAPTSAAGAQNGGTECYIHVWDRVWANGAITTNSIGRQSWTPPALTRYIDGKGLSLWCRVLTGYAPINVTVTIEYTNQAGAAKSVTFLTSLGANVMQFDPFIWQVPLAPGDSGIRAANALTWSVSTTGGVVGLMIAKYLGCYRVGSSSIVGGMSAKSLFSGLPQFDGNACLNFGIQMGGDVNTKNGGVFPELQLQAKVIPL